MAQHKSGENIPKREEGERRSKNELAVTAVMDCWLGAAAGSGGGTPELPT